MSRFDQKIFILKFNFNDSSDLKYEFNIDEAENFIEKKNVEKENNENENIEKNKSEKKNIEDEFEFNVFDDNNNNEIEIEFNVLNKIEIEISVLNVNVLNENNNNENEFDFNSFNVVESNVKNEIKKMIVTSLRKIFEYDSKEEQLNVVHIFRIKKQDVMLITKTKYEKKHDFSFYIII